MQVDEIELSAQGSLSLPIDQRRLFEKSRQQTDSDFFNLTEEPSNILQRQSSGNNSNQKTEDVNITPLGFFLVEMPQKLSKKQQKLGNEIIEQLYVDEVIYAMD